MLKTFAHHTPSEDGLDRIRRLRQAYSDLHELVVQMAPASRERAVAMTEQETSAMWAIKAIVLNDPESTLKT